MPASTRRALHCLGGIISIAILVCAAANLHPLWTTCEVDGATVAASTAAGDQSASAKINNQVGSRPSPRFWATGLRG